MSEEHNKPPHVIRRVKKVVDKHHGGSWKIAYADFVTAMMAFFLLMWLLSMLNKYQKEGIAEYFQKPFKDVFSNPKVADSKIKIKNEKTGMYEDKSMGSPVTNQNDIQQMDAMKKMFEENLNKNPELKEFKNSLNFEITAEGLKIELHDLQNRPMFSEGKTDFEKYAKTIVSWLSNQLNQYPNQVVIIGHTDSVPYHSDSNAYTNWELSADRANATRRELIKNGMATDKVMRVIGSSDVDLLDKDNSFNPANRRIEIIVLTKDAADKLRD